MGGGGGRVMRVKMRVLRRELKDTVVGARGVPKFQGNRAKTCGGRTRNCNMGGGEGERVRAGGELGQLEVCWTGGCKQARVNAASGHERDDASGYDLYDCL